MTPQWYCVINGERRGPLSWEELRACAQRGELQPDDYVWTAEFGATWRHAREIVGLCVPPPPPVMFARPIEVPPEPPRPLSDDDFEPSCRMAIRKAWQRMHLILFKPFDIGLWLGIGFCAWFAAVGRFEWGNLFDLRETATKLQEAAATQGLDATMQLLPELLRSKLSTSFTLSAVAITTFFMVVMMWVRARGALMFVDRWHRPRTPFTETWRTLRDQANSLFATRLVISIVFFSLFVTGGFIGGALRVAVRASWAQPLLWPRVVWVACMGVLAVATLVVMELDRQFVVPILCWRRGTALSAWRVVLQFCNRRPFALLRFLIMRCVVEAIIFAGIMLATMLSCCLFWVVSRIPYFGNVLLLPISFFRNGLGISMLAQWKPDLPPKMENK